MLHKRHLWYLTIPLAIVLTAALGYMIVGCGSDTPDVKNRVPTVQGQLDAAQQAARDAKAAADQVAQTKKDIDAAIDKLDHGSRNSDGSVKIGHAEISGVGTVTDVGMGEITIGETHDAVLWFTFAERGGFVKKFDTVCDDQVVPVGKAVVLNYHFREYENVTHPGCFVIDSYTVVQ